MERQAAGELDSLARIIRHIPRACFIKSPRRAFMTLARDLVLAVALGAAIVYVNSWLLAVPLSLLLGTVLTGLFVVGHDAGHRSFSADMRVNNIVGHLAMTPLLWPFHVWRLTHDHHHRWTHHVEHEIAWRPLTDAEVSELSPLKQKIYILSRGKLFFLASLLFQGFFIHDALNGKFFEKSAHKELKRSLWLTLAVAILYIGGVFALAGVYGLVCLFVVPQLAFHFWLSTFTYRHHTNVDNRPLHGDEWTPALAQLAHTVHVRYPRLIDWLTHDISWHVPHHVCVGVPHYHLRAAHAALKAAYPQWVVERSFSKALVDEVAANCHMIQSKKPGEQTWLRGDQLGQTVAPARRETPASA